MSIYVNIYVYIDIYIYIYQYIYVCILTYIDIYIYWHILIYIHISWYIYIYTHTFLDIYIYSVLNFDNFIVCDIMFQREANSLRVPLLFQETPPLKSENVGFTDPTGSWWSLSIKDDPNCDSKIPQLGYPPVTSRFPSILKPSTVAISSQVTRSWHRWAVGPVRMDKCLMGLNPASDGFCNSWQNGLLSYNTV